jgi:hypothetical protein
VLDQHNHHPIQRGEPFQDEAGKLKNHLHHKQIHHDKILIVKFVVGKIIAQSTVSTRKNPVALNVEKTT